MKVELMKIELEVDYSTWLVPEGILKSIYVGDNCEPEWEEVHTWKELIDRDLESYKVPGVDKFAEYHKKDIASLIEGLKQASEYLKAQVEEIGYHEQR